MDTRSVEQPVNLDDGDDVYNWPWLAAGEMGNVRVGTFQSASARLLPHPLDIDKIIRFEAHLNRQLYQALHQLEAMRAERHGQSTPLLRVDVQHHTGTPEAVDGSTV